MKVAAGIGFRHYRILARILAWTGILTIVVLSVIPANERPLSGFAVPLEHFAAFASVAAVFAIGYDMPPRRMVLLAFSFCAGIELAQIPLETRHARFSDFLIDFFASCAAIAIITFGKRTIRLLPTR